MGDSICRGDEEKGERFNTENTENTEERRRTQRKNGEIPACGGAGLRQRRRPQDDDARRIVRDAEGAEKSPSESAMRLRSWQAGAQLAAPLPRIVGIVAAIDGGPALRDRRYEGSVPRVPFSATRLGLRRRRGMLCCDLGLCASLLGIF